MLYVDTSVIVALLTIEPKTAAVTAGDVPRAVEKRDRSGGQLRVSNGPLNVKRPSRPPAS